MSGKKYPSKNSGPRDEEKEMPAEAHGEKGYSERQMKANEHVRRAAAEFLELESNKTTLITVTSARVSKDFKHATIFISVLPEEREEQALDFAKRKLGPLRDFVKSRMKFRVLPFFDFEIDKGEKVRQKIDEISKKR